MVSASKNLGRIFRKCQIKSPPRADVVILDYDRIIKKAILYDIEYSTLPGMAERIYLSPGILGRIVKNYLAAAWECWRNDQPIELGILYFQSCIEYIKPKVVITWIDNSPVYQRLSRLNDKTDFYYIVNGVRLVPSVDLDQAISMSNLFCWGQQQVDLFNTYGHQIDRYYPVGPIIGSYYKTELGAAEREIEYDICLVSEFKNSIMNGSDWPQVRQSLLTLDSFLGRYLDQHPLSVCIATCSQDESDLADEISYFRTQYGDKVHIIDHDRMNFSTYRAMERSEVSISSFSTACYEAYSWGQKVLLCNFTGNEHYDSMLSGESSVGTADYRDFEEKLDNLLNMGDEEYAELTRTNREYVVPLNEELPAHLFIRNMILRRIAP